MNLQMRAAGDHPLKILHVCGYYPPRIGGVGEAVAQIHRACLARGHQSTVVTSGPGITDPGVISLSDAPARFLLGLVKQVQKAREVDVVHCHEGESFPLAVGMWLRRCRTPLITSFHVDYRSLGRAGRPVTLDGRRYRENRVMRLSSVVKSLGHRFGQKLMMMLSDSRVFIAASTARQMLGQAAEEAVVIHNGIDREPAADTMPGIPSDLVFVGVKAFRKRIFALPHILDRIRHVFPSVILRIVGQHVSNDSELAATFRQLGLSGNVHFDGPQPRERMPAYYSGTKILVMPSVYEGLPMVIMEAGRQGIPCVATDACGHPEIIVDGVSGYLVQPDDVDAFAARCIELLKRGNQRRTMGEALRRTVITEFSVDHCVEQYIHLYRRIRDQPGGRSGASSRLKRW